MNAAQLADLASIPVPMQSPGQPAASGVVRTSAGWRLAWLVGLTKEPFGPIFGSARDATRASIALNTRDR